MNKSQVHNGSYLLQGCSLGGYRSLLRKDLLQAGYFSDFFRMVRAGCIGECCNRCLLPLSVN